MFIYKRLSLLISNVNWRFNYLIKYIQLDLCRKLVCDCEYATRTATMIGLVIQGTRKKLHFTTYILLECDID